MFPTSIVLYGGHFDGEWRRVSPGEGERRRKTVGLTRRKCIQSDSGWWKEGMSKVARKKCENWENAFRLCNERKNGRCCWRGLWCDDPLTFWSAGDAPLWSWMEMCWGRNTSRQMFERLDRWRWLRQRLWRSLNNSKEMPLASEYIEFRQCQTVRSFHSEIAFQLIQPK